MHKWFIRIVNAAIGLSVVVASSAQAQAQGDGTAWLVRARAVRMVPLNASDQVGGIGISDRIHVSDKWIPDVDISYFLTPNWAAELVLTYPQRHTVTLDGASIGSFKHLPPTLTGQYHFLPGATVNPYLGAGINYTLLSKVDLLGGAARLDHDSTGLALQAGVDIKLDARWSFNVDLKKLQIRSDVVIGGARASRVKVDPLLLGAGLGYRF